MNRHGALIFCTAPLSAGLEIEIYVIISDKRAKARVVYIDPKRRQVCGIELGKPENDAIVAGELDVRRFEVAMNDAPLVGVFQSLGDLLCDRKHLSDRQRTSHNALRQRSALDEFHN